MSTRDNIIILGDELIRHKGYNAFSFYDISRKLGIRNASVHYYFHFKADLAIAVIRDQRDQLQKLMLSVAAKSPIQKLKAYFSIYSSAQNCSRVCLVGSLATDLHTIDLPVRKELAFLVEEIIEWVIAILEEGKDKSIFDFKGTTRTKALMIITNMLAAVQLARLTGEKDFQQIKSTIIRELKEKL